MDLSEDLREALDSYATPPPFDVDDELVQVRRTANTRRGRRRRFTIGIAMLAVVAVAATAVLVRDSGDAPRRVVTDGSPATTAGAKQPTAVMPSVPPGTPTIASSAVTTFPLDFAPAVDTGARAVAVGAGSVWLSGYDKGSGFVVRMDPSTGKEQARVVLPNGEGVLSMSFGEGGLWLVTTATDPIPGDVGFATWVTLVDPTTDTVEHNAELPGSHVQGHAGQRPRIATGNGAAWVTFERSLFRVDAQTGRVGDPLALPSLTYGLASTPGSIWLVEWQGPVQRYDTTTGDLTDVTTIDAVFVQSVVASDGAVWITHSQGTPAVPGSVLDLTRVDGTSAATTSTDLATAQVTSDGTSVWAVGYHPNEGSAGPNNDGFIAQLDATSGMVVQTGEVPVDEHDQLDAAVDDTHLWVLDSTTRTLIRVDTAAAPTPTTSSPQAISGISESHQSVLSGTNHYTQNSWSGVVGDDWVQVWVGAVSRTPVVEAYEPTGDGFIYLLRNPAAPGGGAAEGWKPGGGTFLPVPPGTGLLTIESADGTNLTIGAANGATFVLDVTTGRLSA